MLTGLTVVLYMKMKNGIFRMQQVNIRKWHKTTKTCASQHLLFLVSVSVVSIISIIHRDSTLCWPPLYRLEVYISSSLARFLTSISSSPLISSPQHNLTKMPLPNAPPSPQLPQNPNPKPNPPSIAIPVELTHLPFWGALRLLPACANTTGHIPIPTPVDMRGEIATLLEWCARARVGKEMTSAVLMRDLVDAATRGEFRKGGSICVDRCLPISDLV